MYLDYNMKNFQRNWSISPWLKSLPVSYDYLVEWANLGSVAGTEGSRPGEVDGGSGR